MAELHADTLNKIITYDARNMQETLTRDFVKVISRHIDPGRRCPKWIFDVDKPNASEYIEAASRFFEMGGDLDEDTTRSVLGLPKPKPGVPVLSKFGPLGVAGQIQQQQMQMLMSGMQPQQRQSNQPTPDNSPGFPGMGQPVIRGNLIPGDPVTMPIPTRSNDMRNMIGADGIDPGRNVFLQALLGRM